MHTRYIRPEQTHQCSHCGSTLGKIELGDYDKCPTCHGPMSDYSKIHGEYQKHDDEKNFRTENKMPTPRDIVNAAFEGNPALMKSIMDDVLRDKVDQALDLRKIEIANSLVGESKLDDLKDKKAEKEANHEVWDEKYKKKDDKPVVSVRTHQQKNNDGDNDEDDK